MYRDGELEASFVGKERASDASPHRLGDIQCKRENRMNEEDRRSSC
jgi:hypothetical protein